MVNRPVFGFITGLFSISFSLLICNFIFETVNKTGSQINTFLLVALFLCSIESLLDLYMFVYTKKRALWIRKLRLVIFLLAFAYGAFSFFTGLSIPDCFLPNLNNILGCISVIVSSLIGNSLRSAIFGREELYRIINENRHKSLMETFSQYGRIVFEAFDRAKSLRNFPQFTIFVSLIILISGFYINGVSFISSFLFLIVIVTCFSLISIANILIDEHRFFTDGIVTEPELIKKRQNFGYLVLLAIFLLSLLIAGSTAPFKPSNISDFFIWLTSFFKPDLVTDKEQIQKTMNLVVPQDIYVQSQQPSGHNSGNSILPLIIGLVKYLFIAGIVITVFYFLFKPLIKRDISIKDALKLFFVQMFQMLNNPFKIIMLKIWNLFHHFSKPKVDIVHKPLTVTPKNYLKSLIKRLSSDSTINSNNLAKSLELFEQYLNWAYSQGVRWSLANSPVEIQIKVLDEFRNFKKLHSEAGLDQLDIEHSIKLITDYLEVDLFSKQQIENSRFQQMSSAVKFLKRQKWV